MKKFKNREEFLKSKEFEDKDLSFCDLSNLDLSDLPGNTWRGFKFYHTDFTNTNIKFKIYSLLNYKDQLSYCNFTNCDLSYMGYVDCFDFEFEGANFTNTGFRPRTKSSLKNVILSDEMAKDMNLGVFYNTYDLSVFKVNPNVKFSSFVFFKTLNNNLPSVGTLLRPDEIKKYITMIDEVLEQDRVSEGKLYKLYKNLSGSFSDIEKIHFFQGYIADKTYDVVDFSFLDPKFFTSFYFRNCKINKVILPKVLDNSDYYLSFFDENKEYTRIPHLVITSMDDEPWKNFARKRLRGSSFTHFTNLYLELGRACNAKCSFCRNQYLEPCVYDYEAIKNNLRKIEKHINSVVIGGGEPTLKCTVDDLMNFAQEFRWSDFTKSFSTNGSLPVDSYKELNRYKILLSRHATNDTDNNKIFGIKTLSTSDIEEMAEYFEESLTLTATCFSEGIYTIEDIVDYIKFAQSCNVRNIMFRNLHEDFEDVKNSQISDELFQELISLLRYQGYRISDIPIYSTGNYKLVILTAPTEGYRITVKQYINPDVAFKEWNNAAKRTFDLSMAPNGDVYANWNQKSEKILVR